MTKQIAPNAIIELRNIVGPRYVLESAEDLAVYGNDWTKRYIPDPLCIVLPANTNEVCTVAKYCNEHGLCIVPSGGRTGLAGGAVAIKKEVVLSLTRMNRIDPIDPVSMTIQCEAGATTESLQLAAAAVGLYFPLDLASKGSSQIGGNIATNAGGLKVIRFGNMRDSVAGIEVVLPSGEILNLNSNLRKDNTGYDLKHLFIASEGTLGIITRASIKLQPRLNNLRISCMGVSSFQKITEVLKVCNLNSIRPTAFEFFIHDALEIVLKHNNSLKNPFPKEFSHYVLLEIDDENGSLLEDLLEKLFAAGHIEDAVVSSSSADFKGLWALRENITESLSAYGHVRKNDIALAIERLGAFILEMEAELKTSPAEIKVILFGHIGDGNIHINYICKREVLDFQSFQEQARKVEERVFRIIKNYRGSISAEHGIGLTKKADISFTRTAAEVNIMREIKRIFDPNWTMNPGKIFDQI